jgi:hypothetical protein
MIRLSLVLFTLFGAPLAYGSDISGFWKHAEEPGWIEVRLDQGNGTVVRNDKFPERVGREILKGLEADGAEQNLWRGQVYAERLGEYKDARISLPEPNRMEIKVKVGFISRTVEWVRVDKVPASAGTP